MAEFLIKAQDSPVPDSPGKWLASQIVVVEEDGYGWGLKEGMPKFYLVKVPGLSKADALQYRQEWHHNISFTELDHNTNTDTYRLQAQSDMVSASGKNAFSQAQVEGFITAWGGSIVSFAQGTVVFDISVFDAITSNRFWRADVSSVTFNETNYNKGQGVHTIQVVNSPLSASRMASAVREKGGVPVPPDSFTMQRDVARERFLADVKTKVDQISHARRRWYVNATGMAALASNGGVMTVTPAQLLANITDGLTD